MEEYEVGYRKPPKSGQVRKGEVRNPNGRAGKKRASKSTSEQELLEQIDGETVVVDGKAMTRREFRIRAQYKSALKGKVAAIRFIDQLSQRRESEDRGGGVLLLPCDNLLEWNAKAAFAQYEANLERERRNALRRSRRAKGKPASDQSLPLKPDWQILADLDNQPVTYEGKVMTMRELRLRIYQALAAKGNRAAQAAIARIQNAPKLTAERRHGYLGVPEPVPMEVWEAAALQQQAQYREPRQVEDLFKEIDQKAAERIRRRGRGDG